MENLPEMNQAGAGMWKTLSGKPLKERELIPSLGLYVKSVLNAPPDNRYPITYSRASRTHAHLPS